MKILHFADLHLGVENYGRIDPRTGLNYRLLDFLRALDVMVDHAIEEAVDLVIFSGDAYKTRRPSPTYQREFVRRIRRLSEDGIPVLLLAGNHDMVNIPGRASTLSVFHTMGMEHIHVVDSLDTIRIGTRSGDVQIVALPWVNRNQLLTRDEYRNKELQEINAIILEKLSRVLTIAIQSIDPTVPAILALHGSVQGATYGSERSVMLGQEVVYPLSLVSNPAFDYVALGHIHKHQVLREDPPVIYPGSLERVDFGEEKEEKGFIIAEIGNGKTTWQFHSTNARRFVTIDVDSRGQDPMDSIRVALSKQDVVDAVVRLRIRIDGEQRAKVNDKEIREALSDSFYVAAIHIDVERETRIRLGSGAIEALTPIELLARYLQTIEVESERAAVLEKRGRTIIEEVHSQ